MEREELVRQINRLKRDRDAIVLAHNYQLPEIQEIADYLGDSLDLARKVVSIRQKVVVFCGVIFMAESAKVLNPEKTILIPVQKASCGLANKITADQIRQLKMHHPEAAVVGYINTYAEVKGECDICCTSANAAEIVNSMPAGEIIFLPDRNLANYAELKSNRKLLKWPGYCYVHHRLIRRPQALALIKKHPGAVVLAHPECTPEVLSLADHVLGTGGMIRLVRESKQNEFIILTEVGLIDRMRREFPAKTFFRVEEAVCDAMKLTTLESVYESLLDMKYEIELAAEVAHGARRALEKMLERA
ncbi:quinolinate synthase NadA [bacterium]|nr:quinolinate synthase NadA [candidate division CSSED10-310 bacterium]